MRRGGTFQRHLVFLRSINRTFLSSRCRHSLVTFLLRFVYRILQIREVLSDRQETLLIARKRNAYIPLTGRHLNVFIFDDSALYVRRVEKLNYYVYILLFTLYSLYKYFSGILNGILRSVVSNIAHYCLYHYS
jgi:hypothetical protein